MRFTYRSLEYIRRLPRISSNPPEMCVVYSGVLNNGVIVTTTTSAFVSRSHIV